LVPSFPAYLYNDLFIHLTSSPFFLIHPSTHPPLPNRDSAKTYGIRGQSTTLYTVFIYLKAAIEPMTWLQRQFLAWLPQMDYRVWILFVGRMLSQMGTGFTLFYAPIFFVNQVGLPATAVGLGIGSGAIAGVFGRIVGGSLADSPRWGRRWTLLASAVVSAVASFVLAIAPSFPLFLVGNLLLGLGIGLYWPPNEAVVADLSSLEQRREAFALTRLGDTLGLGFGVLLGGALIALTGFYRLLFVLDGISFGVFFVIVWRMIPETLNPDLPPSDVGKGWQVALSDRPLWVFFLVNSLFTTYLALINSAMPLYFANFVPRPNGSSGFTEGVISALFAWHIALAALMQMPVARRMQGLSNSRTLMVSALAWGIGFSLIGLTGVLPGALVWALAGLAVLAIATVIYMPAASSLVVMLAPEAFRGVYLSVNSLCWAFGYFLGPSLGGWAMDQQEAIAHRFWMGAAFSIVICLVILVLLRRMELRRMVTLG